MFFVIWESLKNHLLESLVLVVLFCMFAKVLQLYTFCLPSLLVHIQPYQTQCAWSQMAASKELDSFSSKNQLTNGPSYKQNHGSNQMQNQGMQLYIELKVLVVVCTVANYKVFLSSWRDYTTFTSLQTTGILDKIENPRLQRLKSHLMTLNFMPIGER